MPKVSGSAAVRIRSTSPIDYQAFVAGRRRGETPEDDYFGEHVLLAATEDSGPPENLRNSASPGAPDARLTESARQPARDHTKSGSHL